MAFDNLPGVQVVTVDGGLVARRTPRTKSVLIVGSAGQGPADNPYQVIDRAQAAQVFGFDGSLVKAMEEVATYSDNIFLYRMGTRPAKLEKVGYASGGDPGFTILFGDRVSNVDSLYRIWYNNGELHVWKDHTKVYSNKAGDSLDTFDITVSGTATAGTFLAAAGKASGDGPSYDNAATVNYAYTTKDTGLVFTAAITGVNMTKRGVYVAQQKAFDLLSIFSVQQVYCPEALLDNENVAFYVSSDASTAANNPATNANALDWLKVLTEVDGTFKEDEYGDKVYHWAHETSDTAGNSIAAATFTSAEDRKSKGYYEVNFGYQIAAFCARQSSANIGCVGFIGCKPPVSYSLPEIRKWIGYLPTYDPVNGTVTAAGKGLLGIAYLTGTTADKLNSLCDNRLPFRKPGFFETLQWEYDGVVVNDKNQNPVDVGAYLHVVGDYAYVRNGFGNYPNAIAGLVCGMVSALDDKSAPTNKQMLSVQQLYKASLAQLDALTKANINMLRFKNAGEPPVLLHGMTAATDNSDYTNLLRQRIKFLLVSVLFAEADKFIGESTTDGLQLQALRTALDQKLVDLQKKGYVSRYSYTISTTEVDQRVGRAFIDVNFMPADELIQLRASIGISRR